MAYVSFIQPTEHLHLYLRQIFDSEHVAETEMWSCFHAKMKQRELHVVYLKQAHHSALKSVSLMLTCNIVACE